MACKIDLERDQHMLFFKKSETEILPDTDCIVNDVQRKPDRLYGAHYHEVQIKLKLQQERLHQLAGSTEKEFLEIGEKLQDFYSRSKEIGEVSSSVTEQLGGSELREAIGKLGGIIDRMGDYINLMEIEAEQSSSILQKTLQMISGVDEPLAGFKKIMKVLHVLGISTKIESARLGQIGAGFHNLADDVENLAVQINDKSSRIMGENVSLSCKIKETLVRMSGIESGKRDDGRQVLDKTRNSLVTITATYGKCAEVAAAIATSSCEVSKNISGVVTSMQFHDITRQQLEHVQEALGDLELHLASVEDASDENRCSFDSGKEMASEVYCVCRLQSAQLLYARDVLTAAVNGIVENLQSLDYKGREIALQTREMVKAADGAGESIFIEIENSLSPVVELLEKSVAANTSLAQAIESVAETISEISKFVIDIEMIGEEIKLIALNSQIKAAWTGDEGAALGVLAEAIQRLSLEACAQTAEVTSLLREINRVTLALSDSTSVEMRSGSLDIEDMSDHLKSLLNSISFMNNEVMSKLTLSDSAVQELSNDIDTATAGISVHGAVTAEVAKITEELELIKDQAHEFAPEAPMIDLETLSGRYTMHSEREIHASFTSENTDALTGAAVNSLNDYSAILPVDEISELGDNIELF